MMIPGTHDSGAIQKFQGFFASFISNRSLTQIRRIFWYIRTKLPTIWPIFSAKNISKFITLVPRYSINQQESIWNQLVMGIRFLDLRVTASPSHAYLSSH
jgi:hypothetical protein